MVWKEELDGAASWSKSWIETQKMSLTIDNWIQRPIPIMGYSRRDSLVRFSKANELLKLCMCRSLYDPSGMLMAVTWGLWSNTG